jgi:regulator of replication initiation timing
MSKPTLDNVTFMIQQLTTSVKYGSNDIHTNFNVILEENKSLKVERAFLKQQVTELKEEVGELKASLDSMPNTKESVEAADTIGFFSSNVSWSQHP